MTRAQNPSVEALLNRFLNRCCGMGGTMRHEDYTSMRLHRNNGLSPKIRPSRLRPAQDRRPCEGRLPVGAWSNFSRCWDCVVETNGRSHVRSKYRVFGTSRKKGVA